MAVKIRLKRMGRKKRPFYRVVVADARAPRDGRFIEEIGTYDPLKDPGEIKIDVEKAQKWLGCGAQPTDTVRSLLKKAGAYETAAAAGAESESEESAALESSQEAEADTEEKAVAE